MTAILLLLAIVCAQLLMVLTGHLYIRELDRQLVAGRRPRPAPGEEPSEAVVLRT